MATVITAPRPQAPERAPVDPQRRISLTAGVLYLLTFVSIPTLAFYGPIHETGFMTGSTSNGGIVVGGILELIVALAGIGTAVVLYPIVKRQHEAAALGFVGSRILEAAMIFLGVASLLTIVALRQDGAGADAMVVGDALVGMYDRAFLVGQSLLPAVNGLLLGSLLYRSGLVPRILPTLAFVGAPLLVAAQIGLMFDLWERTSAFTALGALPIAVWEFSLGVYLVAKGFRPAAIANLAGRPDPTWSASTTSAGPGQPAFTG